MSRAFNVLSLVQLTSGLFSYMSSIGSSSLAYDEQSSKPTALASMSNSSQPNLNQEKTESLCIIIS